MSARACRWTFIAAAITVAPLGCAAIWDIGEPYPLSDAASDSPPADGGADRDGDADGPLPATIQFVQSSADHGDYPPSADALSVPFTKPNAAGDLVIVSCGWGGVASDGGLLTPTVSDSNANPYVPVGDAGPILWGPTGNGVPFAEQLFYASGVLPGSNTVRVQFPETPAAFFEVRAFEYAGADRAAPLDVSSQGEGIGLWPTVTLDAGPVTTSSARELLFAIGQVAANAPAACSPGMPGPGFSLVPVTNGGQVIAEGTIADMPGSLSASGVVPCNTLSGTAPWVMQIAAFRPAM